MAIIRPTMAESLLILICIGFFAIFGFLMNSFCKQILPLFLLLCSHFIHAQSEYKLDSLLHNVYSNLPDDTNKVNTLYNVGMDARYKDAFLARDYANACMDAALKVNSDRHLVKAYNFRAVMFFRMKKLAEAEDDLTKAMQIAEKIDNKALIAYTQLNLGNVLAANNDIINAEKNYLSALQFFNSVNNKRQVANAYNLIGTLKYNEGSIAAAKKCFTEALSIANELNDYEFKMAFNNNLGNVLEDEKDYEGALNCYEECFKQANLMDSETEMADADISIGGVCILMKKFNRAQEALQEAEMLCKKHAYTESLADTYEELGTLYKELGESDSAMSYQKLSYEQKLIVMQNKLDEKPRSITVQDDVAMYKKNEEITVLKYIIGVLVTFLVILVFTIGYKNKRHEQKG